MDENPTYALGFVAFSTTSSWIAFFFGQIKIWLNLPSATCATTQTQHKQTNKHKHNTTYYPTTVRIGYG